MAAPKGKLVTPVAFDARGIPRSLEVDALDRLKVVGGGFVYSDRLLINVYNNALAAGYNVLDIDPVPAGWVWVVTHFAIMYAGTSPDCIDVYIRDATTTVFIYRQQSPVSWGAYDRQGWWVLKEGDFIEYYVYGATQNDGLYGYANGFKVQLTP